MARAHQRQDLNHGQDVMLADLLRSGTGRKPGFALFDPEPVFPGQPGEWRLMSLQGNTRELFFKKDFCAYRKSWRLGTKFMPCRVQNSRLGAKLAPSPPLKKCPLEPILRIVNHNASVVKIYNGTSSLVRSDSKNIFSCVL
jgi:hypothetical protein